MKPLPKHLRPRWRYLAIDIEAWPDAEINRRDFQGRLWAAARSLLGDPGSADTDLSLVRFRFSEGVGEAVVRVRREEVERGRAAVACIDRVADHPVGIHVQRVSGTIQGCEKHFLGRSRAGPSDRVVRFSGTERSAIVQGDRFDVRVDGTFVGATTLDADADADSVRGNK